MSRDRFCPLCGATDVNISITTGWCLTCESEEKNRHKSNGRVYRRHCKDCGKPFYTVLYAKQPRFRNPVSCPECHRKVRVANGYKRAAKYGLGPKVRWHPCQAPGCTKMCETKGRTRTKYCDECRREIKNRNITEGLRRAREMKKLLKAA